MIESEDEQISRKLWEDKEYQQYLMELNEASSKNNSSRKRNRRSSTFTLNYDEGQVYKRYFLTFDDKIRGKF